MVGHEDDVMDSNLIFFSGLGDGFKGDASSLSLVEPEGAVIGPAEQVIRIFSLYDTQWSSHALDRAQDVPIDSDTREISASEWEHGR